MNILVYIHLCTHVGIPISEISLSNDIYPFYFWWIFFPPKRLYEFTFPPTSHESVFFPHIGANTVYSQNLRPAFVKGILCSHTWHKFSYFRQVYSQKRKLGLMETEELAPGQVSVTCLHSSPLYHVDCLSAPGSLLSVQRRKSVKFSTEPKSLGHTQASLFCFPVFCFISRSFAHSVLPNDRSMAYRAFSQFLTEH